MFDTVMCHMWYYDTGVRRYRMDMAALRRTEAETWNVENSEYLYKNVEVTNNEKQKKFG